MTRVHPGGGAAIALLLLAPRGAAAEVTIGAVRDNTMYAESGSESNGAGERFFAGTNGLGQARRGLIAFDVAAAVPAGSTITAVELKLRMSKTNAGPYAVRLHRALASWGEGTSNASSGDGAGAPAATNDATWTRRFHPGVSWTTAGGDYAAAASASTVIDQIGDYTWQGSGLVADVQAWLDAPAAAFGWIVVNENESDVPTAKRFDSRQNPTPSVRPALRIVYAPPCGGSIASYCTAAPNSAGPGALMGSTGSVSIAADTFTLTCSGLPPNAMHLFFFGSAQTQQVFGNGFRCVAGTTQRLGVGTAASAAGTASRAVGLQSPPAAGVITPGTPWYFQCWYRNPVAGGPGFNLSDGLAVVFCN